MHFSKRYIKKKKKKNILAISIYPQISKSYDYYIV